MTGLLVSGVLLGFAVVLRRQQVLRRRLARLENARRRSAAPRPPVDRGRWGPPLGPPSPRYRPPAARKPVPSVRGLAGLARDLKRAGG